MNLDELLARLRAVEERIGGRRRALILLSGFGVVAGILGFAWWASAPAWAPLYDGIPLESVGPMTDKLQEAGVAHRLDAGGTGIEVPAPDLARARVALAGAGLPSKGRPGLELFDQPAWGMTDFTQRVNYRRALEGELERTIGKMRGVASAQVHLGLSEQSSLLRGDRPTTASVVLGLRDGADPEAAVVKGIEHLVASSVDGVGADNVMVLDDSGRLLSTPNDGSPEALTSRQLEMQREVEHYLEDKANGIVGQAVGAGNARIRVTADLNFDKVQRTTESVDPDRQVVASEQRAEIVPGPQGGAGSQNSTTTYENTRSVENFSSAAGAVRRLSVAVLVNERPVAGQPGKTTPRAPAELQRIQALVGTAVGIDARRGDAVSVVSMPFDGGAGLPADGGGPSALELAHEFQQPILTLLALLLAFYVAMRLIRSLRQEPAPAQLRAAAAPAALPQGEDEEMPALPAAHEPEWVLTPTRPTMLDRVAEVVEEQPDVAARLVRAWMKEG